MTTFNLSSRSLNNLKNVHPYLVSCVVYAIKISSPIDFTVIEGVRTIEKQREYVEKGTSKTMKSKHLIQADGFGYAVDIVPYLGKDHPIPWNDRGIFKRIADSMFKAAEKFNFNVRWGGDWNMNNDSDDESFYDGPHFELI